MSEHATASRRADDARTTLPVKLNESQLKQPQRKVVGLFWQVLILSKKNFLLARRNVVGTLGELLVAFLFILILVIIRYVNDAERYEDQANILGNGSFATNANQINFVVKNINVSTNFTPIVYYYPDEPFVRHLMSGALKIIEKQQPLFNATCKFKILFLLHLINLFAVPNKKIVRFRSTKEKLLILRRLFYITKNLNLKY